MRLELASRLKDSRKAQVCTAGLNLNEVSVDLTLELKLGDVLVEKAQQLATGLILFHFLFALFVNLQFSVVQNVGELEVSL